MTPITKATLINYFAKYSAPSYTEETHLSQAAVLVPIIDDPHELQVLFTERTSHLKNHAGQISFPGGKMEKEDISLEKTALRETEEEIGLTQEKINILGKLSFVTSSTGFWVQPFVALVTPPLELTLDPHEVAEVFTAPLNFLLNPKHHETHSITHKGKLQDVYVIPFKGKQIWGMTAKILVEMSKKLRAHLKLF
jgi:8-oxo-dGTP pyrophosphatase MutT (NUDIX family)